MTKYVVSTTLDRVDWKHSELVKGDLAEAITALKARPGSDIGMTGSGRLVRSLIQRNLIDELQLCICPVVLGAGKRLFDHDGQRATLQLADVKSFSSGMVMLTYRPSA
jgi:dihydrofolate reductase